MEAMRSSKTSINTTSTRCHIPDDCIPYSHRRENLKSYTGLYIYIYILICTHSPPPYTHKHGAYWGIFVLFHIFRNVTHMGRSSLSVIPSPSLQGRSQRLRSLRQEVSSLVQKLLLFYVCVVLCR
jgi:hypothetical protein